MNNQKSLQLLNSLMKGESVTIINKDYNENIVGVIKSTYRNLSYDQFVVEGDWSFIDEENHFYNIDEDRTIFTVPNGESFFEENFEGRGVSCLLRIPTVREVFSEDKVTLIPDFYESYL